MGLEKYPGLKAFLIDVGALAEPDVRSPNALSNNTISARRRNYTVKGRWRADAELVAEMIGAVDAESHDLIARSQAPLANSAAGSLTDVPETFDGSAISARGQRQMKDLVRMAIIGCGKSRPHSCYGTVYNYIRQVGYGNMPNVGPPGAYSDSAHQFADYANQPGNCEKLGIRRIRVATPWDAPTGALIVVRGGSPLDTSTYPGRDGRPAGDIAIACGNGRFINYGNMTYPPKSKLTPFSPDLLGVYVPR